jgi:hypothetical protein
MIYIMVSKYSLLNYPDDILDQYSQDFSRYYQIINLIEDSPDTYYKTVWNMVIIMRYLIDGQKIINVLIATTTDKHMLSQIAEYYIMVNRKINNLINILNTYQKKIQLKPITHRNCGNLLINFKIMLNECHQDNLIEHQKSIAIIYDKMANNRNDYKKVIQYQKQIYNNYLLMIIVRQNINGINAFNDATSYYNKNSYISAIKIYDCMILIRDD